MSLLTTAFADPKQLLSFSSLDWDKLLRLARNAGMMSTLHVHISSHLAEDSVPATVSESLNGHRIFADHMQLVARRELDSLLSPSLEEALNGIPIVLLKGAAYIAGNFPPAQGRRLSDIDILVPQTKLAICEQALLEEGWEYEEHLDEYHHHYYRQWSHELPPLRHPNALLELDVHHNLVQTSGRIKLDAELLFGEIQSVPNSRYYVLSPRDMTLHCATHLFMCDELRGGLRDLFDFYKLCQSFSKLNHNFYPDLLARAEHLGVTRPLYYALSSCSRLFAMPIPDNIAMQLRDHAPVTPIDQLMSNIVDARLAPEALYTRREQWADYALYLRSHWVRMPPWLLIGHLSRKWWMNRSTAAMSSE